MEDYKGEVEMKQMEVKLLETEIENAKQRSDLQATLNAEIETEGTRLKKQIETMTSLKDALQIQLANL